MQIPESQRGGNIHWSPEQDAKAQADLLGALRDFDTAQATGGESKNGWFQDLVVAWSDVQTTVPIAVEEWTESVVGEETTKVDAAVERIVVPHMRASLGATMLCGGAAGTVYSTAKVLSKVYQNAEAGYIASAFVCLCLSYQGLRTLIRATRSNKD